MMQENPGECSLQTEMDADPIWHTIYKTFMPAQFLIEGQEHLLNFCPDKHDGRRAGAYKWYCKKVS